MTWLRCFHRICNNCNLKMATKSPVSLNLLILACISPNKILSCCLGWVLDGLTVLNTILILSYWTGKSGQTVYLDQTAPTGASPVGESDQGLHCLSFCLHLWTPYSMVKPHSSKYRIITAFFFECPDFSDFYITWLRSTILSQGIFIGLPHILDVGFSLKNGQSHFD